MEAGGIDDMAEWSGGRRLVDDPVKEFCLY